MQIELHEQIKLISLIKKYGDACVKYSNASGEESPDAWAEMECLLDEIKKTGLEKGLFFLFKI